jgi:hypothetical protein
MMMCLQIVWQLQHGAVGAVDHGAQDLHVTSIVPSKQPWMPASISPIWSLQDAAAVLSRRSELER